MTQRTDTHDDEQYRLIPVSALKWLHGEGDSFEQDRPGAYWWRSKFRELCAAAPTPPASVQSDHYADAFYKIAEALGIGAHDKSPQIVFNALMLPAIQRLITTAGSAQSVEPVAWNVPRIWEYDLNNGELHERTYSESEAESWRHRELPVIELTQEECISDFAMRTAFEKKLRAKWGNRASENDIKDWLRAIDPSYERGNNRMGSGWGSHHDSTLRDFKLWTAAWQAATPPSAEGARDAALEEAASMCDSHTYTKNNNGQSCAQAIRALKSKKEAQ